jgi:hypothetical protein
LIRALYVGLRLIDFPVAAVSRFLPPGGDELFSSHGSPTPEYLWHYLRVAVPVYMLLFYLPNLLRGGWERLRRRREAPVPSPS